MTLAKFRDIADRGVIVECLNVAQRKNVLELFEECGYHIGFASQDYLRPGGDRDATFIHPAFRPSKGRVTCFRSVSGSMEFIANAIKYDDVKDIIENPPPLDDRSDAEFASDFASLLR